MRYVILAVVAAALGAGVWWYLRGPDLPPPPVLPAEVTYICRESGALLRLPRQPTPAVNPRTGRATLVQALWCAACQRWYPEPPPQARERMPAAPLCPRHGTALQETAEP